jgi:predicted protein tyrosine phosphatase
MSQWKIAEAHMVVKQIGSGDAVLMVHCYNGILRPNGLSFKSAGLAMKIGYLKYPKNPLKIDD